MPSFVPRAFEPYKKRELFETRLLALRACLNRGESGSRVIQAVEKVRLAALAVVKGRRTIVDGLRESESRTRQLENLAQEESRWLAMTDEEVIATLTEQQDVVTRN